MLVQSDQVALDRGSWALAAEISLEQQPPFPSFAAHSQADATDQPLSRLLEPRWAEIFLHHLQDTENYLETCAASSRRTRTQAAKTVPSPAPSPRPSRRLRAAGTGSACFWGRCGCGWRGPW